MPAGSQGLTPDEWLACRYTQELLDQLTSRIEQLPIDAMHTDDRDSLIETRGRYYEAKAAISRISKIGHGG